jgi:adenylate cyclase
MAESINDTKGFDAFWQAMLTGEHPALKRGRHVFRLLSPTATDRCRLCNAGYNGFTAPLMRAMGRAPWRRNPHFCQRCEVALTEHRGGAEVEIAVLYADVRGSTRLAAGMRPSEFAALMQRFLRTATRVFERTDAIVDKMVGDEVIGIYFPGLTGTDYLQRAVRAGLELLRETGHANPAGPWLPIGVGVHAGKTFVGSIGVEGGAYEFAALGDTMNLGARLVAAAKVGELVVSDAVWTSVSREIAAEPKSLSLKGYDRPVQAHVARVMPG